MARSLPQPEDPVARTGLSAGQLCWVEYHLDGEERSASSQVQDVGPSRIAIATPSIELQPVQLEAGTALSVFFASRSGRYYRFRSEVQGPSRDGRMLFIRRPMEIVPGDRRRSFRLDLALTPTELFRMLVEPDGEPPSRLARLSTIVDLSEGGLCLSTRATFTAGERLGLRVELPGTGVITARVIVRSVETPRAGLRNRRVHCQFISLDREAAELVVQYLLRRQRELRARGQL